MDLNAPIAGQSNLDRQDLFAGGEMGALMRLIDWSKTPIGPVESWSPALKMMVKFLLANRFPLLLWWGPQYVSIYNDPYRPVLGKKHPWALGKPVSECWSEIWRILKPLIDTPFHGGPATWNDDIFLEINRHGFIEETHFTIAYSPVPDETVPNGIGGVLATVHEISEKVVGERRLVVLRDLGAVPAEAKSAEEACEVAAEVLVKHPKDIPFALIYLIDPDRRRAHLACAAGVSKDEPAGPLVIELGENVDGGQAWTLAEVVRTETMQIVEDLAGRLGDAVPPGPWSDPPQRAVVVPIRSNMAHYLAGFLVVGISSRLKLDDLYRSFIDLVAAQIATAIANARAYEEERKRAEALAELDRAKTAFFSNVSHEFRTPLTLMLGPAEDALNDPNDPLSRAQRKRIELLHRNGLRLLKLVNTLLDFSRIEAGRVDASYEPTDLAQLTADLASVFRSAMERAGLRLVVDCPPLPEPVYVDREMWEKIVLNLLSNAFKFTFEGEISVALHWKGDHIVLEVRDTGTGIPENELPHLFERFHRVKGARARTQEGSGIGLALVQELVRLNGGVIHVKSQAGEGTTFMVTLPAGTSHLPADRIGTPRTLASTAVGAAPYVEEAIRWLPEESSSWNLSTGVLASEAAERPYPDFGRWRVGARILLAEDNADMREYVRRLLSARWTVEAFSDGNAALDAAKKNPPDLVLSDVMMPGLDGFQLLQALRNDPGTKEVPLIMLSARCGEEARVEGLEAGADDYLVKPFSARELLARVGAHLELSRLRREALHAEQKLRAEAEAAREEAQEASRVKSQFVATVSHDLKTPLSAIIGYTHLLLGGIYGAVVDGQKKPLEGVQRNAHELLKLIADVLDMAKIESGKMSIEVESIAIAALLKQVVTEIKPLLDSKGLSIRCDIPNTLPTVESDAIKIKQIFTNLLSNAIKFTDRGGITIEVKERPRRRGFEFAVEDTGIGVKPEALSKIFETFYQVGETGRSGGSGLGLAIVKNLTHLLQGEISVESEYGTGSTFKVFLPYRLKRVTTKGSLEQ